MSPIVEYILEIIQSYTIWILTWSYDNLVILLSFLCLLTTIVFVEYIFVVFTGKKKTEIIMCLCKV